MLEWWPSIGETSIAIGSGLGLIWAVISTSRRRKLFLRAGEPPVGQARWFVLNFASMGAYLTLVMALGLASAHELIPQALFWYLLGLSALAFSTALLFPVAEIRRPVIDTRDSREPPANPPLLPLRKSA